MIRTKGEPGTGDVIQAVSHMRTMNRQIRELRALADDEVYEYAKSLQVPLDLAFQVHETGRLPVVNFAAGGNVGNLDGSVIWFANNGIIPADNKSAYRAWSSCGGDSGNVIFFPSNAIFPNCDGERGYNKYIHIGRSDLTREQCGL